MRALGRGLLWTLVLGCACFPSGFAQTAKESIRFRITGTVVNDRNGEPVPFCHMSAFPMVMARGFGPRMSNDAGPRLEPTEVNADAKGRFSLEVPSEGRYRLSASARGFRVQLFEAHGTFSTAVVLTKALPAHAVVFRASEDATISGEVTDEAGEGVRQAQVKLYAVDDPNRTTEERRLQMRNVAMTDDRGHYELPAMPAGSYKLSVTATPWYATPNPTSEMVNGTKLPSPDPSLDVVYPLTWYPSTDNESLAEKIEVKYGDKKQMDFRLAPVTAAHVRVSMPVSPPSPGGDPGFRAGGLPKMPQLERVLPDGTTEMTMTRVNHSGGEMEIGGLAPGTYRMVQPGASPDAPPTVSMLQIAAGGTVTEGAGVPEIPVTIRVDGDPTVTAGQVSLTDTTTGQAVGRGGMIGLAVRAGGTNGPPAGGPGRRGDGGPDEAIVQVPAGTYEVVVNGRDSFLTGVTATGAEVTGRVVKIAEGNPHLLVHMAAGLASIDGVATRLGKPSSGAMVLLVPATLGNPANLDFERRAQTATDGSFQFTNVIPGQYILLAIDHGWGVNWRDQATLRPYLLQGEPLDLAAAATAHPALKAIAP